MKGLHIREEREMAYEHILVEKKDRITWVTINRPEVMNALHPPANLELDQAFNEFSDDPEAWVAIITGAGDKAFSAGNDLKFQAEHGGEEVRAMRRKLRGGFGGLASRFDCYKPIIAAVNGFALGGGFEIALACDLIIASENATFGLPEPRVGLMAGAGGVHRLPRQMPHHAAMGVILAGQRLTAERAYQYGLVNEVVPQGELLEAAERWAKEILMGAPLSIRASKEAVIRAKDLPLDRAMEAILPHNTYMYESEDVVEGVKAFAEKRKPNWKGR